MSTEENKANLRRWTEEGWNQGNVAVFEELSTVAKKYILVDQSGRQSCYPHKRSMVSWEKAECRVTDFIQPLTYIFPEEIRRPRGDVGGNRSASPEPLYDSELRDLVVMVGRLGGLRCSVCARS